MDFGLTPTTRVQGLRILNFGFWILDLFRHATSLKSGNPPTRVAPLGTGHEPKNLKSAI
ncbi:hypothetical protein FDUTEX481_02890 [Tolypothrix sp. PCC 7601]|nr:hypothetical protein FDUTEX481_02890 [Tolypothrix sp. PCC 7601]